MSAARMSARAPACRCSRGSPMTRYTDWRFLTTARRPRPRAWGLTPGGCMPGTGPRTTPTTADLRALHGGADRLLTVSEVPRRLRVCTETVYRLCRSCSSRISASSTGSETGPPSFPRSYRRGGARGRGPEAGAQPSFRLWLPSGTFVGCTENYSLSREDYGDSRRQCPADRGGCSLGGASQPSAVAASGASGSATTWRPGTNACCGWSGRPASRPSCRPTCRSDSLSGTR
jgi:hypothetical protein